jgi:hypothetical protein
MREITIRVTEEHAQEVLDAIEGITDLLERMERAVEAIERINRREAAKTKVKTRRKHTSG